VAGSYEVAVRPTDVLGNTSQVVLGEFELTAVLLPDTTPMTLDQLSPALNATVKVSGSAITGVANDDRSVASVDVAIKDKATNLWLKPDGTWTATFTWLPTTLASPGAASTGFTRTWAAVPGSFGFQMRASDASGNVTNVGFRGFTVISDDTVPDTSAPVFSQLAPGVNAVVPASGADISGVSTDDRAVASVDVAIRDKATNLWLKPDGTWTATFTWLPATLGSPGSASTTFTRAWAAVPGAYGYQLRTADTSGKTTNQAFRAFTVN
jgi:hypothetical protein